MKQAIDFSVVERRMLGDHFFLLTVQHPSRMEHVEPGQFVEVEVRGNREVMLRRPISVHDVDEAAGTMKLLIQIAGCGTRQLATVREGDRLNIVYPLGHGFSLAGERPLLVGGGAGIAPLLLLAKGYAARGVRPTILLGGRTASLIPVRDEFRAFGEVCLITDDGSLGERGMVTQHSRFAADYDHICCCGPTPMMKAVAAHARTAAIDCEVSLENMMACGIGACLCCVTKTTEGHKCVCTAGPVFDACEVFPD